MCASGGLLSYPDVTPQDIKTPLYSRSQLGLDSCHHVLFFSVKLSVINCCLLDYE